ncbi:cadherin EGF LAG seven-pass G-type receptor 1-like [Alosa sapidissima]|uniref:cadherin EGF LAG seven-pass G-type receptor 1-like n=1 Tax=Alosa sapidissima TaxID=34773 RepID=UPI001C096C9F|nr:cadherin EGF LAG seven-pass G-type receptor 1-like [Alosa sapidissima]
MGTSLCVWVVILSAWWFADFIRSLPVDDLTPLFEYDRYEASIPENELGPVLEVLPAPIKANTTGNHTIIYSIGEVSPRKYWNNFIANQSTGVLTVVRQLDFEKITDNITIIFNASLEIDNTRTTNTSVTVHVENVNESPVFRGNGYSVSIYDDAWHGSTVVTVKATDPENESLRYLLQSSNPHFGVRPNGQVYVQSLTFAGNWANLRVRVEDPHGLYAITSVQVRILDRNRRPEFQQSMYTAEIFDNAPRNTPVVQVQARDPDAGDNAGLRYVWWISDSRFYLDSSSGQLYVLSTKGLSGTVVRLGVRVEDPKGLDDTTSVEVTTKKCHTTTILLGTLIPLAVILCGILIFVIWKRNAIRKICCVDGT